MYYDVDGRCYVYMEICLVFHFHYCNHQTIHHCSPGHFDDDVVDALIVYLILMKS